MARPVSITDDQILDAARTLFLDRGMGASTAAIAREAGVSEGSIFKRFKTKERLFLSAMGIPELDMSALVAGRAGTGDVKKHLVEISLEVIRFFRVLVPRMMRLWAHGAGSPLELMKGKEPPPIRVHRELSEYIAAEMAAGRMRAGDASVVARMFLGTLHNRVVFEVVGIEAPVAEARFAADVVQTLWEGVAP